MNFCGGYKIMAVKVLVVDDEKLIVKGLKFSLEQDDMEVECASASHFRP